MVAFRPASQYSASFFTVIWSFLRTLWVHIFNDNLLIWKYTKGAHNPQADHIGPLYIVGAPNRNIDDGKAVLASNNDLKLHPFLPLIRVTDPEGKPVPNTKFDFLAETSYSIRHYGLRGTFVTDANGTVEVPTIAPKAYGRKGHLRAAHFHTIIDPPRAQRKLLDGMTTQLLNLFRPPRVGNVLQAWCIPENAKDRAGFMDLLALANPEAKTWKYTKGARNPQAEHIGPLYIVGAPNRNIDDGKAVLASYNDLKNDPFLLTLRVTDPEGNPVPNTKFDFWQVHPKTSYSIRHYGLRGTFVTDASGTVEVLSITPREYGPKGLTRAGHFHMMIDPPRALRKTLDSMTTQLYVCAANHPRQMETDVLNVFRPPRLGNLLKAWCIPENTKDHAGLMDLPALDDSEVKKRVDAWHKMLSDQGYGDAKVVAGAQYNFVLNPKGRALK
ncbi:aromatic compound dioxygenase [Punctularia strigosozonata HHB-11173 SS5]|uniref:aromatic compound dioxygenase n=1 Tax=Punctularia strigosozonata (strain HHB-11173) TaxID=741275 RepID=UPI00044168A1|nr:aromatic compound dioxygenase [Punctularia strigosozonata HHB-11173 SS5]EIN11519.1 aromatic compound dioxygenase [Punctularia strigosozonata HHB-11173 SS5]